MSDVIRVFVADDNRLLCEGLVAMLGEEDGIVVVGSAPNGGQVIENIKDLGPDVALIDIDMVDKDGVEIVQQVRRQAPQVNVIVLGMVDLTIEIMACIEAGAVGYAFKETSFENLAKTIRAVQRGESLCSPQMAASLFSRIAELASQRKSGLSDTNVELTARELEVINAIAEGLSNKAIAQQLFIETQTVKNHVHNILDKLQLKNRLQAVAYARERNLLQKK